MPRIITPCTPNSSSSSCVAVAAAAAMTKKRAAPLPRRLWIGLQLVASLSVLSLLFALLRIQSATPPLAMPARLRFGGSTPFVGDPKIAFLFLVRKSRAGNFSIFVHSKPGFKLDQPTTRSPFFYGRQHKDSVQIGVRPV